MKKIIITLFAVLALTACKTASVPTAASKHREAPEIAFTPEYAYFAQPTPARDTLYLLKNDNMANVTYNAWQVDTITRKPAIVFISEEGMKTVKRRFNGSSN